MKLNIALVGGNTRVASEMLEELVLREFPLEKLHLLEVDDSIGRKIKFNDEETIKIENLEGFDFSKIDIAFFVCSKDVSLKYIPIAVSCGALAIDKSGAFSTDFQVPMVIPEVNPETIANYKTKGIISIPNCSSTIVLSAISCLHNQFLIKNLYVASYQSVSGKGNEALEELFEQTRGIYSNASLQDSKKVFTKQIAFNVIPHIGDFLENGNTKEEQMLIDETHRILSTSINVNFTAVRVPVFISHCFAITMEFEDEVDVATIKSILEAQPSVAVVDYLADEGYVTPAEAAGEEKIYVSRIRQGATKNSISIWVVADNLRKAIAINMIQIAEQVLKLPS